MRSDYKEIWGFLEKGNYNKILLVDCMEIFRVIQQQFPGIEIYTIEKEALKPEGKSMEGKLINKNYFDTEILQIDSFDCIIVGYLFEKIKKPIEFLKRLLPYLKMDGDFLASFHNRQYWSRLNSSFNRSRKDQLERVEINKRQQLFSLPELAHLFEQAKCREIQFSPLIESAPDEVLLLLQRGGYNNENRELETLNWGVCASKVNKKALILRKQFRPQMRETMVFLLRRIENEISITNNCSNLWEICEKWQVTNSYLVKMIDNTMIYPDKVIALFALYLYEQRYTDVSIDLLLEGYSIYQKSEKISVILISLLNTEKRWGELRFILSQYAGKDPDILRLKEEMKEKRR